MESIVMDSHGLMMSEEQQQHLYKRYSVEMSIREPKKLALLSKVGYLKKSGATIPSDLLQKVESINEKWELLGKTLGEKIQSAVGGQSEPSLRDMLSPQSGKLVKELEVQIKELKGWLRETELFIFNSCLRREKRGGRDAEKQLQYFKSLCCEIKQRRRGVSSILRLCQHLLENQETCNLDADHQSMQLIIVNLERRWEAIVMQAVQWQTRLQKQLGQDQEITPVIDLDLMDLNGTNEDALEWDETDISHKLICINEESNNFEQEQKLHVSVKVSDLGGYAREVHNEREHVADHSSSLNFSNVMAPFCPPVYQVYSLHNVELYEQNYVPFFQKTLELSNIKTSNYLQKNLSKDSKLPSTRSLPDIVGRHASFQTCNAPYCGKLSRNSGSESGIISEGDTEITANSDNCLLADFDGTCSQSVDTDSLDFQMTEIVDVLKQKIEDEKIMFPGSCQSVANAHWVNGKDRDFKFIPYTSKCLQEEIQEKHDVFTFYDYSYLQGSRHNWPVFVKHVQAENLIENGHREEHTSAPHFCFDVMHCRSELSESQPRESMSPVSSIEVDLDSFNAKDSIKILMNKQTESQFSCLSHGSSLDSLCIAGDLFGSNISRPRDCLQRSTSLESWLVSCKSNEDLFSHHSSGDISISSDSVGELSKRTLDLLKRLEDIESPSEQKIKHSISDITLQSSSQKMSLPGQLSLDHGFSMNEDSVASLTELSSSEELSLCSEDIVLQKNKIPDSNASFQKHLNQSVVDESDVNVSMIVNVSCTSACTDDEDDSDLLSSSTLTLTEEELCIKDEDDSSIATDEDIYEESSFLSGIDYIKNELHTWSRPKFLLLKEKKKCNFSDSIHCEKDGTNKLLTAADTLNTGSVLNGSSCRFAEDNANSKNISNTTRWDAKDQTQKESLQVGKNHLVDDVENGNVESTDDRSKKGLNRCSLLEDVCTVIEYTPEKGRSSCELLTDIPDKTDPNTQVCSPSKHLSKDCQNYLGSSGHQSKSTCSSLATNSCTIHVLKDKDKDIQNTPVITYECENQHNGANVIKKSSDCCSSFIEMKSEDLPSPYVSCCRCDSKTSNREITEDCSVHNFVMEIIDMASMALKNKSQSECEMASPASLTQIKEKVLEHSHRPIQLRKGDFYSYLSLSSHDSDCGEVVTYTEDKNSSPKDFPEISLDMKDDIEYVFEACTDDEPAEEQSRLPSCVIEGLVASGNLVSLDESKAPISLQPDKTDDQDPSSIHQKVTHVKGDSMTLETCIEDSFRNPLQHIPVDKRGNAFGNGKSKPSSIISRKVSTLDPHLNSSNMKEQNILHHNTKTLTSKEDLQPFHEKTIKYLKAESNPPQVYQALDTKKPGLTSGADLSSSGQDSL